MSLKVIHVSFKKVKIYGKHKNKNVFSYSETPDVKILVYAFSLFSKQIIFYNKIGIMLLFWNLPFPLTMLWTYFHIYLENMMSIISDKYFIIKMSHNLRSLLQFTLFQITIIMNTLFKSIFVISYIIYFFKVDFLFQEYKNLTDDSHLLSYCSPVITIKKALNKH